MGATHLSGLSIKPVSVTASTLQLNEFDHSGKTISLDRAAGQAVTLPIATGSGAKFILFVGTTITGSSTVKVKRAADLMAGAALVDGAGSTMFQTAADTDTITMNGSTQGGLLGSEIVLEDVKLNLWKVWMISNGSSSEISPFTATV